MERGSSIGRYTVERPLGGSGARVWLVRDPDGHQFALRTPVGPRPPGLRIPLARSVPSDEASAPSSASVRETPSVHPNLVGVREVIDGAVVLEYVDGLSLAELLQLGLVLSIPEVDALADGILRGVVAAREQGRILGDVHPGNVLLAVAGDRLVPKVGGSGWSSPGRAASIDPSGPLGGAEVHEVLALGVVLFALVEGRAPQLEATSDGVSAFPLARRADLPERIRAALAGALAPADRRLPSVGALLSQWDPPSPGPFAPRTLAAVAAWRARPVAEPTYAEPSAPGSELADPSVDPDGGRHVSAVRLAAPDPTPAEIAHLASCIRCRCRAAMRQAAQLGSLSSTSLPPPFSSPGQDSDSELVPGTLVGGKYVVERVLGAGGMGRVYAVRHAGLGSVHALKLIRMASHGSRLLREGQLQAQLEHSNIVRVTDLVVLGGACALVMEYVRGPTLARWIAVEGPRDGRERDWTVRDKLAQGILRGARAAHQGGWVHRDLKPANILLAEEDDGFVPKIADFGLARLLLDTEHPLTRPGALLGTPAYMAPEQFSQPSSVDARADVFALGAVLYEMCTGRRAFAGVTVDEIGWQVVRGTFVPPRALVPDLPARMEAAILGALKVDRAERFDSCSALLETWVGEDVPSGWLRSGGARGSAGARPADPPVAPPPSADAAPTTRGPSWPARIAAVGVVLVGVAAVVASWPPGRPAPPAVGPDPAPKVAEVPLIGSETPDSVVVPPPTPPIKRIVPKEVPPVVAPPAPETGTLRVVGDVRVVKFERDGTIYAPGAVPPGRYRVVANFPNYGERATDLEVDLAAGEERVIECNAAFTRCRVVP